MNEDKLSSNALRARRRLQTLIEYLVPLLLLVAGLAGWSSHAHAAARTAANTVAPTAAPTAEHAAGAEFLDAEQAFVLSPTRLDERTLELRYDIAPGYHLYRERFAFESAPQGRLHEAVMPPGRMEFDPQQDKSLETYRGILKLRLPVAAPTGAGAVPPAVDRPWLLSVTSQGCADRGLCYSPLRQDLRVDMHAGAVVAISRITPEQAAVLRGRAAASEALKPSVSLAGSEADAAGRPSGQTEPAGQNEAGRIQIALQSGHLLAIAAVFLVAGLLLSLTPCMLPMVPILSSIIVGQQQAVSRLRGFVLAAAYSLGMALVYTVFGVVAGLLGEGLAAALQNAWVLGGFALLLAAGSLSMFGLFPLQMPAFMQSRVAAASGRMRGGSTAGVFVMGGLSALIVGPCVAAPLAGALVYISRTHDVLIGGLALFSLACGMSVPLLLVGLSAGSLLPRAGVWMESVKQVFGVLLLAVALWLVSPVLPAVAVMALGGALLLIPAVYLHAFDRLPADAGGWARLFKGVGLVLALVGASQLVGALAGGRDVLQPLAALAQPVGQRGSPAQRQAGPREEAGAETQAQTQAQTKAGPAFRRVSTVAELEAALKAADKPVLLDFYADWCSSCREYELFTFADPQVRDRLGDFVLLQADVTADSSADKALLRRFELFGPPAIVFFDRAGHERPAARVVGYQPGPQFLRSLQAAAS